MTLAPYRCEVQADWIDYNGHLRDAYYGLVLSHAMDDLMEQLEIGEGYRRRTGGTLYTLETHLHYLREVKRSDALAVTVIILDTDPKRIQMGAEFRCDRLQEPVATAEAMLLHVRLGDTPASAPLPTEVQQRLEALKLAPEAAAAWGPASRKLSIRRR